jgi:hypothetical protein
MVNNNKTKKKDISKKFKNTRRRISLKRNQIGGRIESITSDDYDRRLGIEDDNTFLKTILQHHFDNFGNYTNIINNKKVEKIIINEPLLQDESFLQRYSKVFELLNNEHKIINFEFTYNIERPILDWDVFETEKEFNDIYNVDIGRSKYITKEFETLYFEKVIKDGKPYKEILTKDKHCIDCSEDFINHINTENSKIRYGFKLLITQKYPLIFLAPFNMYDQFITNEPQLKKFSSLNIIINNCIYKFIFFENIYNHNNESASYGYILIKYDPSHEHKLSMMYYSTNTYFNSINNHVRDIYQIIDSEVDIEIFTRKVLKEIKDIIIKYNVIKNKPNLLQNKLYDYRVNLLREYYKKYIYYLKV